MPKQEDTIAAVDLGSNSFHLQIARVVDEQVYELDSIKETVRLAAGLDDAKRLTEAAQETALACLGQFGERLRGFAPDNVRAVGTNALRIARNSRTFIARAERVLGFPIEIIAGREEARLIYLGVAHSLPQSDDNRLVVDIGGGSTECIVGRAFEPLFTESLYMGCVSYTQQFFSDGKISAGRMQRAEIAARAELQTITGLFHDAGWSQAYGSSGTARALSEIIFQNGYGDRAITADGLERLRARFIDVGDLRRLDAIPGVSADRAPVIAGGLAIMSAVFAELSIERMDISPYALRHGVLFDLIGRSHHHDMRETTVQQFERRYSVDREQGKRVRGLAMRLIDPLASAMPEAEREHALQRLDWACRLHEIGISIAYSGYHKHSAYIARNADMPGFSRSDQECLAAVLLAHRGSLAKAVAAIDAIDDGALWPQILMLRLACMLSRRRARREDPPIAVMMDGTTIILGVADSWLLQHPLSAAALENEVGQWKSIGRRLVLERS